MAKNCDVCGKKLKLFKSVNVTDGKVCYDCMKQIGIDYLKLPMSLTIEDTLTISEVKDFQTKKQIINVHQRWEDYKNNKMQNKIAEQRNRIAKQDKYEQLKANIKADKPVKKGKVYLDFAKKQIFIDKNLLEDYHLYNFSDFTSYKTIENPTTINKNHSLSHSVIGGLVAGPTGAVIGAFAGNKSYDAVSKMAIILYFKDNNYKQLNYISTATKIDTINYRTEQENMQRFCAHLDKILAYNTTDVSDTLSAPVNTDQLRNLKGLLDDGVITQADFDAKKKQILGL
ncbi:DUF4428 domain-containing protein [Lactiplantibacillus sp. DA1]|uniref:DUF4428 domain-containing protein n=1 Tax=Lactiplantibacillus sp. DA1 TaxID=3079857 RepID=UPI00292A672A|nr:DUF4428 domain-containing protein [Lactiplantibacillus sp. DA1]MDV0429507.1 DUF4428 domain-containing protein [Lactiplantibacillus sp. DA1]